MPRMARIVVPGFPHHITQRGIRGHRTFFNASDCLIYLEMLKELLPKAGVALWAYCLMPNHVHFVAVPSDERGLAVLFRPLHSQYAKRINAAHGWRGHLWQERFYSVVMDEPHTLAAMRYVEQNPVRAGLCKRPDQWRWSSIHANLAGRTDGLVDTRATRKVVSNWHEYTGSPVSAELQDSLRKCTRNGRPAGASKFIDDVEASIGKRVRKRKPGRSKDN